jgi:PTH1 family peptidyl-tRNA hydrolase
VPPNSGDTIKLIVGLANPGRDYEDTRHNAGAWFVEQLARDFNTSLQPDSKFFGLCARISIAGQDCRLLIPTTFMNRSGQAVAAICKFYKIEPEEILVAHDELDLPPGTAKLKKGGGHGGHNGLRDIISSLGNNKQFYRLRLGIGHPGSADKVVGYVLGKTPAKERELIESCIYEASHVLEDTVKGQQGMAMNRLHSFRAD